MMSLSDGPRSPGHIYQEIVGYGKTKHRGEILTYFIFIPLRFNGQNLLQICWMSQFICQKVLLSILQFVFLEPMILFTYFFSECCWRTARVLANESCPRSNFKKWSFGDLWISTGSFTSLYLFCYSSWWVLLWQLWGELLYQILFSQQLALLPGYYKGLG